MVKRGTVKSDGVALWGDDHLALLISGKVIGSTWDARLVANIG